MTWRTRRRCCQHSHSRACVPLLQGASATAPLARATPLSRGPSSADSLPVVAVCLAACLYRRQAGPACRTLRHACCHPICTSARLAPANPLNSQGTALPEHHARGSKAKTRQSGSLGRGAWPSLLALLVPCLHGAGAHLPTAPTQVPSGGLREVCPWAVTCRQHAAAQSRAAGGLCACAPAAHPGAPSPSSSAAAPLSASAAPGSGPCLRHGSASRAAA